MRNNELKFIKVGRKLEKVGKNLQEGKSRRRYRFIGSNGQIWGQNGQNIAQNAEITIHFCQKICIFQKKVVTLHSIS